MNIVPITFSQSAWLHLLRWVAAFLVCITHVRVPFLADFSQAGPQPWPIAILYAIHGFGHMAVVVFFCLSGYLVGGEVVREFVAGTFSWRKYLVKRVARIYPVYGLALLLTLILDWVGIHYFNQSGIYTAGISGPMLQTDFAARLTPSIGFGNLLFFQEIFVPPFGSNRPLWSLAYEAWYYVLFPLGVCACRGKMGVLRRGISIGLFGAVMWLVGQQIMIYFLIWLMGLLPVLAARWMPRRIWWPALGMLLVLGASRVKLLESVDGLWVDAALACCVVLFIGSLGKHAINVPGPIWFHRFLSNFSYSLYLVHWPFALFLSAALNEICGMQLRSAPTFWAWGLYGLIILAVYFFAFGFSRISEHHTLRTRNWLGRFIDRNTKPRT
jgi:peptidoglycan/LPS O-acetylase OafA/YrhL